MESRLEREKNFHDHSYSEDARASVGRYYIATRSCWDFYRQFLKEHGYGKRVLEYGCGTGSFAFILAKQGAQVTGIDISQVAIRLGQEQAAREQVQVEFVEMNAEALTFPDESFDLICGTGILHHLDLERAYAQIAQKLRPGGKAVFLEPLGHNPLLNLYRRLTANLRTPDEHPLLLADLELARKYFNHVQAEFFNLTTLVSIPLLGMPGFFKLLAALNAADRALFKLLPLLRKHAWNTALVLAEPVKG